LAIVLVVVVLVLENREAGHARIDLSAVPIVCPEGNE
jgi:hypothetical protein